MDRLDELVVLRAIADGPLHGVPGAMRHDHGGNDCTSVDRLPMSADGTRPQPRLVIVSMALFPG
jgi:hypothetical protein